MFSFRVSSIMPLFNQRELNLLELHLNVVDQSIKSDS